jgi:hypothetical protein
VPSKSVCIYWRLHKSRPWDVIEEFQQLYAFGVRTVLKWLFCVFRF